MTRRVTIRDGSYSIIAMLHKSCPMLQAIRATDNIISRENAQEFDQIGLLLVQLNESGPKRPCRFGTRPLEPRLSKPCSVQVSVRRKRLHCGGLHGRHALEECTVLGLLTVRLGVRIRVREPPISAVLWSEAD